MIACRHEVLLNLRQQFGLDDPIYLRYGRWFTAMTQGNWATLSSAAPPVIDLIMQRLPVTLFVLGSAYFLALLIALPVGILSAVKPYSIFDQIATTFAFIGYSLPTFFTGLLFILVFSIYLDWLPFIYSSTIEVTGFAWALEHLRQGAMPIAVLGLFQAALLTRLCGLHARSDQPGFRHHSPRQGLARARRHPEARPAQRPDTSGHGDCLRHPGHFHRALITEQIFRVPGIGSLLIGAIESNDTPWPWPL